MEYLILLSFLFAPSYVLNFKILQIPTNFLLIWLFFSWLVFAFFLFKNKQTKNFIASITNISKINILIWLFAFSGLISLYTGGLGQKTFGEFLVIFVQPITTYYIARFIFQSVPSAKSKFIACCYLLLGLSGLIAIIQYFFGFGLPQLFAGNDIEPKRAVSLFIHPNFFALWAAPILSFLIPELFSYNKQNPQRKKLQNLFFWLWLAGLIGLLLSLSRSGLLGILVAGIIYFILSGNKKTKLVLAGTSIFLLILFYSSTSLNSRITSPFKGEKSALSRIVLWESGIKAIKQSPLWGLGLGGYAKAYRNLISDQTLPNHNFPHNIFLNLWVETGIIGLISFTGIIGLIIYLGLKDRKNTLKLSVVLFLITLLTQGLIDNPYFKNDLALVFWTILAIF